MDFINNFKIDVNYWMKQRFNMKVILAGQFQDASGYGNAARNFLKAFDKNKIAQKRKRIQKNK